MDYSQVNWPQLAPVKDKKNEKNETMSQLEIEIRDFKRRPEYRSVGSDEYETVGKKDYQQNQNTSRKVQRNPNGKCGTTNTSTTEQSEKDWKEMPIQKTTQIIGQKEGMRKEKGKRIPGD